jgi:serine/threonine-protein phosphatase 6 regulatory ankyrin repeat subunit B
MIVDGVAEPGNPPASLLESAKVGNVQQVRSNLNAGADANMADSSGSTALHLAAWEGHAEVTKLLVEARANVNVKNNNGFTPLHFAADQGYVAIVKLLLKNGAKVDAVAEFPQKTVLPKGGLEQLAGADPNAPMQLELGTINVNWTALGLAAGKGRTDVVEALLAGGADVNVRNGFGDTPLHNAAKNGNTKVFELLLSKGVDANPKNKLGQTPLDLAVSGGHAEIVKLLEKRQK